MAELKQILLDRFQDFVDKIILYGSRTKNTENEYSDHDILLIINKDFDWRLEKEIKYALYDVDFDYDILTDIKLISKNELNSIEGRLPFIQDALENGISL